MCRFILFIPTLLFSFFAFSQKNVNQETLAKNETILKADLQKIIGRLDNILQNQSGSTLSFVDSMYKNIGLLPVGSNGYAQPFSINFGKEIKPATKLRINDIQFEAGLDYWPFAFCANSSFTGTMGWDSAITQQPFLYDLKYESEKRKKIVVNDLLKHIKEKAKELADNKIPALIVYNTSAINDSLFFSANDTSAVTDIPVIYFTKSGISKLKNESPISNTIEAKIEIGKKIITGTNEAAFLNNNAANTIIIIALQNNIMATATVLEIAKLLNEAADPLKKRASIFNTADYSNANYLFLNCADGLLDNYATDYFLQYLPSTYKINYALKIGITGAQTNSTNFIKITGTQSSSAWETIFKNFDPLFNSKIDSAVFYNIDNSAFYKNNIPIISLINPSFENAINNKISNINNNDVKTIDYVMQLIKSANNYGKLPFNKTTE